MQTNLEQALQETPRSLLSSRCCQSLAPSETVTQQDVLVSWETGEGEAGGPGDVFLSGFYLIKSLFIYLMC